MPTEPTESIIGLPDTQIAFVAWIDLMGSGVLMKNFFAAARYRVYQFHILAALTHRIVKQVSLFPMNDGLFVSCEKLDELFKYIDVLHTKISVVNSNRLMNDRPDLCLVTRCAVAYGAVADGKSNYMLYSNVISDDENARAHMERIIVGAPVSISYSSERHSPPLGIFLDQSVPRSTTVKGAYYRWKIENKNITKQKIYENIEAYFDYQDRHCHELNYDKAKSNLYKEMAKEYFLDNLR